MKSVKNFPKGCSSASFLQFFMLIYSAIIKKQIKITPSFQGPGLSRNGKTLFNNWTVQKDLNNQGPLLSFSPFNNPIIPPPFRDPEKEFLVHAARLCKCCSRIAANRCHNIRHVVSFYFRSAIRQMTPHFHSGLEGCK